MPLAGKFLQTHWLHSQALEPPTAVHYRNGLHDLVQICLRNKKSKNKDLGLSIQFAVLKRLKEMEVEGWGENIPRSKSKSQTTVYFRLCFLPFLHLLYRHLPCQSLFSPQTGRT